MEQDSNKAAESICLFGKLLYEKGLIAGNQGNLSLRLPNGDIMITPSGRHKALLEPQDIITIAPTGKTLAGTGKPSTDTPFHLGIYSQRPDVMAVCHAHPISTVISLSGGIEDLSSVLGRPALSPVPVLDNSGIEPEKFVKEVQDVISENDLFILYDHGVFACGNNLEDCLIKIENLEHDCIKWLTAFEIVGPEIYDGEEDEEFN